MFTKYWGLKEKPFTNTPDPKFLYLTQAHREALTRLSYAVEEQMGAAMLTGVFGCGKTLLGKVLAERLSKSGTYTVAFLSNPLLDKVELLRAVAYSLRVPGLPVVRSEILADSLLQGIEEVLLNNYKDGKNSVIIIDEAHLIQDKMILEELRLLLNFQLSDRFLLSLVLLGQPEFRQRVENIKQLDQRIPVRYHIDRLDREDTVGYIRYRLKIAGRESEVFSDDAIELIHRYSGGIPRRINQICQMSLLSGFFQRKEIINAEVVHDALRQLDLGEEPQVGKIEVPIISGFPARAAISTTEPDLNQQTLSGTFRKEWPAKDDAESAERMYLHMLYLTKEISRRAISGDRLPFQDINTLLEEVIDSLVESDILIFIQNQNIEYDYFTHHTVNSVTLTVELGLGMGMAKGTLLELGKAAWLRDLGMLELDDLVKKPAKLSEGETKLIFSHPDRSQEILRPFVEIEKKVLDIIGSHHERLNGKGYPKGLKGDEISMSAQIVGLADTYEALVHPRHWRETYPPDKAIDIILKMGGTHFNTELVKALITCVSFYPVGSFVRLSTNEVARVVKINKAFPMRPSVEVFLDASGERLITSRKVDLTSEPFITVKHSLGLILQPSP